MRTELGSMLEIIIFLHEHSGYYDYEEFEVAWDDAVSTARVFADCQPYCEYELTEAAQRTLWRNGDDVPVDDDGNIEAPWCGFDKGTNREEIWHWIESNGPLDIHELMFENTHSKE